MPISYLRGLTGKVRSGESDRQLAMFLAFIAGAANAGGFLAVRQYTSHMSGIVSSMADGLALRDLGVVLAGVGAVISFMAGAAATAVMVNWGRRRGRHGVYAMPLMVEAGLLLVFGVLGSDLARERVGVVPATVMLLCFTMGLQNAIITKISHAVIRTTHVTGMVTDIGIELGKLVYWNTGRHEGEVRADWGKLGLLGSLVGLFFVGGVWGGGGGGGAVGFKDLGFVSTVPLAVMLVVLAGVPVMDDLRGRG